MNQLQSFLDNPIKTDECYRNLEVHAIECYDTFSAWYSPTHMMMLSVLYFVIRNSNACIRWIRMMTHPNCYQWLIVFQTVEA